MEELLKALYDRSLALDVNHVEAEALHGLQSGYRSLYTLGLLYPWKLAGVAETVPLYGRMRAIGWRLEVLARDGNLPLAERLGHTADLLGSYVMGVDAEFVERGLEIAWESLSPLPAAPQADGSRPTALPATRRDSLLVARARQEVLKEVPRWPVDDCLPTIEQGDFGVLRLDWVPRDKHLPADVQPTDRYYQVTFVDKRWRERKYMFGPSRISVCLVESTQEAYNVQYDYTMIAWLDGQLGNAQ